MKLKRKKKIGLALGGGAVLGAAHIGVLKAITEHEIPIHYIAGTSIGAFMAALYAFGLTSQEIETLALDLNWLEVSGISLSQYGVLNNKKLGKVLDEKIGKKTFADAIIPMAIVAVDINSGEKVVCTEGEVAEAVMASTCIPGVFIPVKAGKRLLVDGGVLEPVPVSSLTGLGAKFTIAVNLFARRKYQHPKNVVDLLINALDIMMVNTAKMESDDADLLVEPNLDEFNLVDTRQVPDLIEVGYQAATKMFRDIV